MKLPRVRFTVRRMMVAVAILAIGFAALALGIRSEDYREKAEYAAIWETYNAELADNMERHREAWAHIGDVPVEIRIAKCGRLRDYYRDYKQKYRRLARYPWLPVAPDPPEPE